MQIGQITMNPFFGPPAVVVPISPIALTLSSPYHSVISLSNNPFLYFIK